VARVSIVNDTPVGNHWFSLFRALVGSHICRNHCKRHECGNRQLLRNSSTVT